jgi:hypothetical protein
MLDIALIALYCALGLLIGRVIDRARVIDRSAERIARRYVDWRARRGHYVDAFRRSG